MTVVILTVVTLAVVTVVIVTFFRRKKNLTPQQLMRFSQFFVKAVSQVRDLCRTALATPGLSISLSQQSLHEHMTTKKLLFSIVLLSNLFKKSEPQQCN